MDQASGTLREYDVEGTTFSPYGSVKPVDGNEASTELHSGPIRRLAEICAICNDARIVYHEASLLMCHVKRQPAHIFGLIGQVIVL